MEFTTWSADLPRFVKQPDFLFGAAATLVCKERVLPERVIGLSELRQIRIVEPKKRDS